MKLLERRDSPSQERQIAPGQAIPCLRDFFITHYPRDEERESLHEGFAATAPHTVDARTLTSGAS
jgi:hypothetical protein